MSLTDESLTGRAIRRIREVETGDLRLDQTLIFNKQTWSAADSHGYLLSCCLQARQVRSFDCSLARVHFRTAAEDNNKNHCSLQ
jgi:hypothetical protein